MYIFFRTVRTNQSKYCCSVTLWSNIGNCKSLKWWLCSIRSFSSMKIIKKRPMVWFFFSFCFFLLTEDDIFFSGNDEDHQGHSIAGYWFFTGFGSLQGKNRNVSCFNEFNSNFRPQKEMVSHVDHSLISTRGCIVPSMFSVPPSRWPPDEALFSSTSSQPPKSWEKKALGDFSNVFYGGKNGAITVLSIVLFKNFLLFSPMTTTATRKNLKNSLNVVDRSEFHRC